MSKISSGAGIALAAALVVTGSSAALAQREADATADSFRIPENVSILGPGEIKRRAAAVVNGQIITGTDVDQRVALLIAASGTDQLPPGEIERLRLQVFRTLIDETLRIQEAKVLDISVTPEEVNQSYEQIAGDRFNRTVDAMNAFLIAAGSSPESLKRQIEGELAWDRLMRRNVAPYVSVSASEVNEIYARMMASKGEYEYRVAEIWMPFTPGTRDATQASARQVFEELRNGASFPDLARQYSKSSTASRGGDLGWIKLAQLKNPQLEQVAASMEPDQMVGPLEIPGEGFDILFMIDRRQVGMADPRDSTLSLKQISIEFPKGIEEDKALAQAQAFADGIKGVHGCGEADAAAARLGAEVVTNEGMRARDLPDALVRTVLNMSIGEATPPFGSLDEGVRVLMLCGREDPPSDAGPSPEQLMAQLEDDRIQKRAERYMRDLRRDAVIEYN